MFSFFYEVDSKTKIFEKPLPKYTKTILNIDYFLLQTIRENRF